MFSKRCFYRRNRKTLIVYIVFLFVSINLFSQNSSSTDLVTAGIEELDNMESWLLFEKGLYSFNNKNYGESLNFFNKLIERHGVYPEAEYWIGRVFEQEGEYILAEEQYLKALEAERILLIPSEKYEIKYRLADLYKNLEDYDSYKLILNSIVMDEFEENQLALANESAAINTLKRDGVDRTLLLFRHEFSYSVKALNELGVYYYKTGEYRSATSKLIFPLLSLFSISIDYMRELNPEFIYPESLKVLLEDHPDYVFNRLEKIIRRKDQNFVFERNLETLDVINKSEQFEKAKALLPQIPEFYLSGASFCLDLFHRDDSLKTLIDDYNIYMTLFYLGSSLYAQGYTEVAFKLWEIVYNDEFSQMWGRMAFEQLENPEIEIGLTIF